MNQEGLRRIAGHRHGCRHGAVSFVPMRENGGRTPSPGRPTAAPLTAGPLLSAATGADAASRRTAVVVEFAGTAAVEGRRLVRLAAKIGPAENPGDAISLRLESRRAHASIGCHGPGSIGRQ